MEKQKEPQKNRCIRCGRPVNGRIGPVCKQIMLQEMLEEVRDSGFHGRLVKGGVQLLIRLDEQPLPD